MTLSDGTTSYSITQKLYCNKIDLYQFATKSTANTATIVSAIITAVLFVLLFVIAFANLRSVPEENKKHVTKYKAILSEIVCNCNVVDWHIIMGLSNNLKRNILKEILNIWPVYL